MGLLNDAIREHLELKRQHGADPGEVARLEGEALGPVVRGQTGEEGTALDSYPEHDPVGTEVDQDGVDATIGQETAELDMQSVLGDDEALSPGLDRGLGSPAIEISTEDSPSDSLEWEVPTHPHEEVVDDTDAPSANPDVEDVLEETPDFLQETPEHERLWFEQQPPRDFDFDK
jgi:hypothetical protein